MKMRVLFTSTNNGHDRKDPNAWLVDVFKTSTRVMRALESSQEGVGRLGGSWKKIMEDGNIPHQLIAEAKYSDLQDENFDFEYKLITGNY